MRLIVIGATGYIGAALMRSAVNDFAVVGTSSRPQRELLRLDLNAADDFGYLDLGTDDCICLTAAISSPDVCAREHERAWALNVTATSHFIARALDRGARVMFFSSDTVYGECVSQFDESAPIAPAGEYAAMKAAVERSFQGHAGFKAIRLSYVFSNDDKFTRYLRGCAERGETADVFDPFLRSIIHREDVLAGIAALARRWQEVPGQTVNFGGPELVSRVEFAQALQLALPGLTYKVTKPGPEFFVARPRAIHMTSPWLVTLLGRPLTCFRDAVSIEFPNKEPQK